MCYLQLDSESLEVGKAAIGNLLGGIGYFYGQSKILFPQPSKVSQSAMLHYKDINQNSHESEYLFKL